MRCLVAVLTVLALLIVPASAQRTRKHQPQDNMQTEDKKPKVNDKDYKSALERIPTSEQKVDPFRPWSAKTSELEKALSDLIDLTDRKEIVERTHRLLHCQRQTD